MSPLEGSRRVPETQKPKLIFFSLDLFSHFLRCLQLADAVRGDFDVSIASSRNPKTNAYVRERGYPVVECKTVDAERMSLLESRVDHAWMRQEELEPIFLDQVRVIQELRPDLVISDTSITLPMAAEYTRTRCHSLIIAHFSKYARFPRKAPAAHPGIRLLTFLHCPAWVIRLLTRVGEPLELRSMYRGIQRIRKKFHLKIQKGFFDELESEQNLITDIEDFSPVKNLPANFTYIGPVFNTNSASEDEVLARLDPGKKTLLVTLGTFWKRDGLFGLFNDPVFRDYNVVVAGTPEEPMNPTIIHKPFMNLEALLPRTDLLVCHGGDATVYQSLSHGVPLLGLPFISEQTWSLQRVARLGFGEEIAFPLSAGRLHDKVRYWINRRQMDKDRFQGFAKKISLEATQRRFRDTLLHLNQRTFCPFCRQGTFEGSADVANVPSDVRRYLNEYFTVWRCSSCDAIHSLRTLDLKEYYRDYPYDQIDNSYFVKGAIRHLGKILRGYGAGESSRILLSGNFAQVKAEILQRSGFRRLEAFPREKIQEGWSSLPRETYDFILMIYNLDAWENPQDFIERARVALKPGGRLLIQSPDASQVNLRQVNRFIHDLHQPYHLHIYSKRVLLRLAKAAGLTLVNLQHRHFWDTLLPFVNLRTVHFFSHVTDGSLDSTVFPWKMPLNRWWHLPQLILYGLFGGVFRRHVWMLAVFERPFIAEKAE